MRIACWITKATGTHSEYEMMIDLPQQQLLHERASVLRLYVRCFYCCLLQSFASCVAPIEMVTSARAHTLRQGIAEQLFVEFYNEEFYETLPKHFVCHIGLTF